MNGLRRYQRRMVIVHQDHGPSIQGVLVKAHLDCLILSHARNLDAGVDLGGDVVIPRAPGVYFQTVVQA